MIYEVLEQEPYMKDSMFGHIRSMYIEEKYRQSKIATMLVAQFEKDLLDMNIYSGNATIFTADVTPIMGMLGYGYRSDYIHLTKDLQK